jgi:colanic acid biosynthesis glycosyl transferase WcaI
MNIVLITEYYPPQLTSNAPMMQELAEELASRGHRVVAVTAWPQHNPSNEAKGMSLKVFSVEKGVILIRVKTLPLHNNNFIARGISQLLLPYLFWIKIRKFVNEKPDVVFLYSPPLPLTILGVKIKKKYGARFVLNIQDIFPQNAIDLGIMKSKIAIKLFECIEKKAYQYADKMTSHTQSSRKYLIKEKKVSEEKVYYIPNWIDIKKYSNLQRRNVFRIKYELENKFIFLFPGTIGPSQGLDIIISLANSIKKLLNDVCFLIVGGGIEKDRLRKRTEQYSLENVVFQPFVSQEDYPSLVKDADVGIVCLSNMNKTPVIPGKILGFMAASIPVVAFLNRESDGHALIKSAQCGYSTLSDAPLEEMKKLIVKIYNEKEKLKQYGKNGFRYVSTHFAKETCIDNLIKISLQ